MKFLAAGSLLVLHADAFSSLQGTRHIAQYQLRKPFTVLLSSWSDDQQYRSIDSRIPNSQQFSRNDDGQPWPDQRAQQQRQRNSFSQPEPNDMRKQSYPGPIRSSQEPRSYNDQQARYVSEVQQQQQQIGNNFPPFAGDEQYRSPGLVQRPYNGPMNPSVDEFSRNDGQPWPDQQFQQQQFQPQQFQQQPQQPYNGPIDNSQEAWSYANEQARYIDQVQRQEQEIGNNFPPFAGNQQYTSPGLVQQAYIDPRSPNSEQFSRNNNGQPWPEQQVQPQQFQQQQFQQQQVQPQQQRNSFSEPADVINMRQQPYNGPVRNSQQGSSYDDQYPQYVPEVQQQQRENRNRQQPYTDPVRNSQQGSSYDDQYTQYAPEGQQQQRESRNRYSQPVETSNMRQQPYTDPIRSSQQASLYDDQYPQYVPEGQQQQQRESRNRQQPYTDRTRSSQQASSYDDQYSSYDDQYPQYVPEGQQQQQRDGRNNFSQKSSSSSSYSPDKKSRKSAEESSNPFGKIIDSVFGKSKEASSNDNEKQRFDQDDDDYYPSKPVATSSSNQRSTSSSNQRSTSSSNQRSTSSSSYAPIKKSRDNKAARGSNTANKAVLQRDDQRTQFQQKEIEAPISRNWIDEPNTVKPQWDDAQPVKYKKEDNYGPSNRNWYDDTKKINPRWDDKPVQARELGVAQPSNSRRYDSGTPWYDKPSAQQTRSASSSSLYGEENQVQQQERAVTSRSDRYGRDNQVQRKQPRAQQQDNRDNRLDTRGERFDEEKSNNKPMDFLSKVKGMVKK